MSCQLVQGMVSVTVYKLPSICCILHFCKISFS
uniref:Uncharacterized protein n=1 Tax=Rhizophora mucronata TaxID=61149 RepID=A0A2P2NIT5_RHIMU